MKVKRIACAAACLLFFPLAACDSAPESESEIVSLRRIGFVHVPGGLDYVAMREWPDAESERIAELYPNAQLNIISERNGWYYVEYRGLNGYVKTDCVVDHRDSANGGLSEVVFQTAEQTGTAVYYSQTTTEKTGEKGEATTVSTASTTRMTAATAQLPASTSAAEETEATQTADDPQPADGPQPETLRTTSKTTTRPTTSRSTTSRSTTRPTTASTVSQTQPPQTAAITYVDEPGMGTCVSFGNYYHSNFNSNKTPITWMVLDDSGDDMLLLSLYAIDVQPYHNSLDPVTWEECDLRQWLNGEFLNTAFSAKEQERINVTHLFNGDNPYYDTPGGNDTDDKVFLLSVSEAEYYLNTEELRGTWPTLYAESRGAFTDGINGNWMHYTQWWLRTPGGYDGYTSVVPCGWEVNADGLPADNSFINVAVRPCIRIQK